MTGQTYSVSELAIQLQLPRTTINDWLKNFSSYLEYEMKGKRKEYNQNALNVLKNISIWKNEGKSAASIQKLLEENYGLCGELSGAEQPAAEQQSSNSDAGTGNNSGELMQVVHSDLEMLLANVENLNVKRVQSTRRAAWLSAFVMLLILGGVCAAGYFIYCNMQQLQRENAVAKEEYSIQIRNLQTENKNQLNELNKLRKLELDKLSSDFDSRNEKFSREIAEQKKDLADAFKNLEKSVSARREAELIKLREAFAAEQKTALEKLIAKEKELTSMQIQLKNLQKHAETLQKKTDVLQKKTETLNSMLEQERLSKKRLEEEYQALNKLITSQAADGE